MKNAELFFEASPGLTISRATNFCPAKRLERHSFFVKFTFERITAEMHTNER